MGESTKTGSDEFGEMLRRARERLGMSRRDLAEATGLSYPYISQLETGYRMPSLPATRSLADALGLPADDLLGAIPPNGPRAVAPPPSPAPESGEVRTLRSRATSTRLPASIPAAPAVPRAAPTAAGATGAAPAGAPGEPTDGPATDSWADSADPGAAAGGGRWIQNRRYASSVAAAASTVGAGPGIDAPAQGPAVIERNRDRAVDEAAALLNSVPVGERLAALGDLQTRVVRSVVADLVRTPGRSV